MQNDYFVKATSKPGVGKKRHFDTWVIAHSEDDAIARVRGMFSPATLADEFNFTARVGK